MHKASILVLLAALTASLPAGAQSQTPAAVVWVAAEKTQFRLTLGDGRVMRSSELIGAKLIVATETGPIKVQISAVERDPDARSGDVWLHTLLVEEELYNACTRMVRADYAGKGEGTTRNGMSIDMFDELGIQKPDNAATQNFEAGWTPQGAVCVRHVRVKENTTLAAVAASNPRLLHETGDICTEAHARALGARLFNRSAP